MIDNANNYPGSTLLDVEPSKLNYSYYDSKIPEYKPYIPGKWKADWCGNTLTLCPEKGSEPNFIVRLITTWGFGMKWYKNPNYKEEN